MIPFWLLFGLSSASELLVSESSESLTSFSSLVPGSVRYSRPLFGANGGGVRARICSARDKACSSFSPSAGASSSTFDGLSVSCELMRRKLLRLNADPLMLSRLSLLIQLSELCLFLAPGPLSGSCDKVEKELVRDATDAGRRWPLVSPFVRLGDGAAYRERPEGGREVRIDGGGATSNGSSSSSTIGDTPPDSIPNPGDVVERAILGALAAPSDE